MNIYIWASSLLAIGCLPSDPNQYHNGNFQNQFNPLYVVTPDAISPKGIAVDTSGLPIDLNALDAQVDHIEACLGTVYKDFKINRSWLEVKIASDAMISWDRTMEVLPQQGDIAICYSKGMCLNSDGSHVIGCECHVRSGIQNNEYIITTPSRYLISDPLIRMITSVNDPWVAPLATCATPIVPALSGLVTKTEN